MLSYSYFLIKEIVMSKNVEQMFADLLNDEAAAASTADLAKLIENRKKRDAALVSASAQHTKDIAALQAEVAALKKGSPKNDSIFDMSMQDWGEILLMGVGGALLGYGVAKGMNYMLSDSEQA
jgi:translation initiation factor 2 gamma subunit (eIF-2gamma)